ncbi:MAG TPA: rRNA maturation RNAse YbeY [Thermoanaerobaculia bacterium]
MGASLATEVRYLIVHGILHSLGYDHETDAGQRWVWCRTSSQLVPPRPAS